MIAKYNCNSALIARSHCLSKKGSWLNRLVKLKTRMASLAGQLGLLNDGGDSDITFVCGACGEINKAYKTTESSDSRGGGT